MRTEVKLTAAVGKTLEGVAFSYQVGQAVLTFSDGTFATLGVSRGDESGDEEIEEEDLNLLEFGDAELICNGVVTAEELKSIRVARNAEHEAANKAAQEKRDRQEFERLKNKFGA